jgi:hypothetical protein
VIFLLDDCDAVNYLPIIKAWCGRQGSARLGLSRLGGSRQARRVQAWWVLVRHGRHGTARCVWSGFGRSW